MRPASVIQSLQLKHHDTVSDPLSLPLKLPHPDKQVKQ